MARTIYVIGHKNSDLDSVASAYAYTRLLHLQGQEEAIAARNGELKPEVRFTLERYGVQPPDAIDDVYLQVRDVMRRGVICAHIDQPFLEAGSFCKSITGVPCQLWTLTIKYRVLSPPKISPNSFLMTSTGAVNRVPLERDNLVKVLQGRVLVEGRRKLGDRVIVGAMQAETMADYIEPGCLVVLGDREDAQLKAIEVGAGGAGYHRRPAVSQRVTTAAQKQGVLIISTAYHTFTVVRLINLSINTQDIMNREFDFCHPDDHGERNPAYAGAPPFHARR